MSYSIDASASIVDAPVPLWIQRICEYYNSLKKKIRSIAWIRRFALFKAKRNCPRGPLSTLESVSAHNTLIRHVQSQAYEREIHDLKLVRPC